MATKNKNDETVEEIKEPDMAPEVKDQDTQQDDILDQEFDRLIPGEGEPLTLSDGTQVNVKPLKLNGLFAAFRIITRGAAMSMGALSFSLISESQEEFAQTLIALLINAFPEASFEFAEFTREMVEPVAPAGGWNIETGDKRAAEAHLDELLGEDPEIDDAFDIVATVIYREAGDIQRLGKKIASAAKMFGKIEKKTPQK